MEALCLLTWQSVINVGAEAYLPCGRSLNDVAIGCNAWQRVPSRKRLPNIGHGWQELVPSSD